MPNEPKTDQLLLERLARAAKHEMTSDELRRQRVSFVFGGLPEGSSMTKAEVERRLERFEGHAA